MKRKEKIIHKIFFSINSLVAVLLLFSFFLPYISPKKYPSFAVISLGVPILIIINVVFVIFWLVQLKKQFLISFITLLLGFNHVTSLFLLSGKKVIVEDDIKVMSYNVKGFNHLSWAKNKETTQKVFNFITRQEPDVLVLQESYMFLEVDTKYSFRYLKSKILEDKFGQAIYSKHPIINSGSLSFKSSTNNAIFIDIVVHNDTIRVYNVHLESLKVNPKAENFGQETSEKLYRKIKNTFATQAEQTELFLSHKKTWKGKTIICGDFNNTAFSWVYNEISSKMKDAFLEAGKGFGKTYDYSFPLRIDFILVDKDATVNHFKTFDIAYSDHFPVMAHLNWK